MSRTKTLKQLCSLIGYSYHLEQIVSGISIDSRLVKPGELFFALRGTQTDGHRHLEEVAAKRAVAAVVDKNFDGAHHNLPLIRVEDPLQTLQLLAKNFLRQFKIKIAAITGSVGKTTTKDFIASLLKTHYRVISSEGNHNSQVGLPLVVLNQVNGDEEILVLEMGMTLPGHISTLIEIAPPHIAVLTCVALVHAGNFNSLYEISRAKAEIFSHPSTEIGILPKEIQNFEEVCGIGRCRKVSFSIASENADYFLQESGDHLKILTSLREKMDIAAFSLPGEHNRHNLLAAIACARSLGLSWNKINEGIKSLRLPDRRLQMIEQNGILFVNDSYNASEVSVKAALRCLPTPHNQGRRVAVLGDMLELGKFSEECHREVGFAALKSVDVLFCLGDEVKYLYQVWQEKKKPVYWFTQRSELVRALSASLQKDDVVLLKGSRGMQLWKILEEMEKK